MLTAYTVVSPKFCELNGVVIYDNSIRRVVGSSPISNQKWLHDQVLNSTRHVQCHAFNYKNNQSPVMHLVTTRIINPLVTNYNQEWPKRKSRQTKWEWQLLISILHIHDVVTRYNNRSFLCACASTGLYM